MDRYRNNTDVQGSLPAYAVTPIEELRNRQFPRTHNIEESFDQRIPDIPRIVRKSGSIRSFNDDYEAPRRAREPYRRRSIDDYEAPRRESSQPDTRRRREDQETRESFVGKSKHKHKCIDVHNHVKSCPVCSHAQSGRSKEARMYRTWCVFLSIMLIVVLMTLLLRRTKGRGGDRGRGGWDRGGDRGRGGWDRDGDRGGGGWDHGWGGGSRYGY